MENGEHLSEPTNEQLTNQIINNIMESYRANSLGARITQERLLSRDILLEVLKKLNQVLFPGYFEPNRVRQEFLKYQVGERIEFIQYHLKKQIAIALGHLEMCDGCSRSVILRRAEQLVQEFLLQIPKIRTYLETDVRAAFEGDPAAFNYEEVILSYPGLHAITVYRIAHELWALQVPLIPRIMTEYAHSRTGIDIHPGATIGKYFFIDHGTGIVIGETTKIGENVKIYQGVTLGALSTRKGQALKGVKRHPTIGDNVTIYSGTTILGGETVIGNNVTVAGNTFIVHSISENMRVSTRSPELEYHAGFLEDDILDFVI